MGSAKGLNTLPANPLMLLRVHIRKGERIVALCDEELSGRVLREGGRVLDLHRYAGFYGRKEGEGEAKRELARASSVNAVGEKAVGMVLESGLAGKGDVAFIQGVPHIQVYRL